jgi:hypothetical protein
MSTTMTVTIIAITIILDGFLIWGFRKFRNTDRYRNSNGFLIRLLKWEEKFISRINAWIENRFKNILKFRPDKQSIIEIIIIGIWAFWVGRVYLDLDPQIIPSGREYLSAIQTHHLWTNFLDCGSCAMWNGSVRGGYPAFADIHGSMLHPIVILTTLIFGVLNGAKIAILLSFWIAGIAQWWISKELKLGTIPRLWSGGMAVVGGHLSSRMELGAFGMVLSTAMCSLVFGALLSITQGKKRRGSVLLGITLASALISGQGYMQVGLISTIPLIAFFIINSKLQINDLWKYFLLGFVIAGLIAAVFLVPFLHFSPNFDKYYDPDFFEAQPLKYIPLNYVIDSYDFYKSDSLNKLPYPYQYTLFIGWISIGLAVYGLTSKKISKQTKLYFVAGTIIILLVSSGDALKLLTHIWEGASAIRHPTQIAGLTIPLILGLSSAGLEKLLKEKWPIIDLRFPGNQESRTISLRTQRLILIPLIISLNQAYQFARLWTITYKQNPELNLVLQELETDSLQWVQTPFGNHDFIEPAIRKGYKISPGIMTFWWADREHPEALLEASFSGISEGASTIIAKINNITIYKRPGIEYAAVVNSEQKTPCKAEGKGGHINVTCFSDHSGHLIVKENNWKGWKAKRDGGAVAITGNPWIMIEAPSGFHTYSLRYSPWDVPLGIGLSIIGIVLSALVWKNKIPPLDILLSPQR